MHVLQSNGTFLQCYISKQIDISILTLLIKQMMVICSIHITSTNI
jgi:hypothetical protein